MHVCPQCGAAQSVADRPCWLCGGKTVPEDAVTAEIVEPRPSFVSEAVFAALSGLMGGVLVIMGIGLWLQEPALGIGFAVLALPALVATLVRGAVRRSRGQPVTWAQRLATFAVALSITLGVLSLLVVAAVVALFIACLHALSG
jgi:hypothetical protein